MLRFVFDLQGEPSTRITTKLLVEEGPGENVVGNAAKFRVRVWKMDKGGKSGPQGQFVLLLETSSLEERREALMIMAKNLPKSKITIQTTQYYAG